MAKLSNILSEARTGLHDVEFIVRDFSTRLQTFILKAEASKQT